MLCVWVNGCDPERVSDGLDRGWHYTKLSLSSALLLFFSGMCFALLLLSFCLSFLFFCFHALVGAFLCR